MKKHILFFCFLSISYCPLLSCMEITPYIQWPLELVGQIAQHLDFKTKKNLVRCCKTYYTKYNNDKPFLFNPLNPDEYTSCMVHYAQEYDDPTIIYLIENENTVNHADRITTLNFFNLDNKFIDVKHMYRGNAYKTMCADSDCPIARTLLEATKENNEPAVRLCLVLEANVNIRECYNNKDTSLHIALNCTEQNNTIIMRLLTHKDVDINSKNKCGYTPLNQASASGNIDVVKWLLKNKNLNQTFITTRYGYTALHSACMNKHPNILKLLVTMADKNSINQQTDHLTRLQTPLHCAAENNCIESVKILLTCDGINTKIKNLEGETAHKIATRNGYNDIATLLSHPEKREPNYQSVFLDIFSYITLAFTLFTLNITLQKGS